MEKQYTFIDLIKDVFEEVKVPLTPEEVWEKAQELSLDKKLGSNGKTPWATLGARLYVDIKENGDASTFVQVSKRPARFLLRSIKIDSKDLQNEIDKKEEIEKKE
jgi:hypothetical protein